ncbi:MULTISPECIES: transcription antitermination factor NusB [Chloracidobacterium]|jgi:N utilization substance protein B|nr:MULTISPECIES: transcription antitermination factor NusB [Chloracidobacterium]QUV77701.1 transcription antitermination factor NusB [Chloracidobacterium thermophilum]QUV80762.1 transcription antitermination factor NusB [Chloracidobacterium sp. D]
MGSRRRARECALQMLFQYDLSQPSLEDLFESYWNELTELKEEHREKVPAFANRIVAGVIAHLADIDLIISRHAERWRISRMAAVDRNILRMAVYEFLHEPDTPRAVVINEALEIARRFSTLEATQFINGILDAIKRELDETGSPPPLPASPPTALR